MNKNLKKVISAVAALSLSASSIAALAVDFPDVDSSASYSQAVSELSALGVISGYEDGTFRPDDLVTRAEITKMIVDAIGESASAESGAGVSTQFGDVTGSHWAAGYVATGVANQFISGYSDTEFGPDDNVTYVQAQTMLVRAIGYEQYAVGNGGYPNGYKTWAATRGITTGVSANDNDQLTRAQVAQMIDNAMGAPLCMITSWETNVWGTGQNPVVEIKDGEGKDYQTLFTNKHKAYKVYGRVTDTSKTGSLDTDKVMFKVEKADNFDDEYVKSSDETTYIEEEMYIGDSKADQYVRTYAQALVQKDDDDEYTILTLTPAAANKSVTLAAEDFDESKSTSENLYFYPAGTTRSSVKYALDEEVTIYVNGVERSDLAVDDVIEYLTDNETASVTLQKETNAGSTSSSTKYNIIMISSYATAVVDEVIVKSDSIAINFDTYSDGLAAKMTVYTDDDTYTYSFSLDDAAIDPTDLEEGDVLSISYDETGRFADSTFYDVLVSRDTVTDAKCTSVNSAGDEFTIGGTKYKFATGISGTIEVSSTYDLYLDHFGNIAKFDESSVSKNLGILKNIYKKAGGDYIAQVITKEGIEQEYKVDDKNVEAYTALLDTYDPDDKSASYDTTNTKLDKYPEQVIEYTVSSSTSKITIKNSTTVTGVEATNEYKAASSKIGTVKLSDSTVIIDISDVNTKDEYRVLSKDNLVDGNKYTVFGYDKSNNDSTYRFVLITEGVGGVNSTTQLAIFNGRSVVEDGDDDRDAYDVVIDGEEQQVLLDDDVEFMNCDGKFEEGDAILFATNAAGYATKIYPVFNANGTLNEKTYDDIYNTVVTNGQSLLADTDFVNLLSADEDVDVKFGVVANKNGSSITLCDVKDGSINYDTGLDITTSGAKVYTYDFSASSKYSKVLLDEGLQVTPDVKAAKSTNDAGQDILDLTNEDVADDVVFAVIRTFDDDEAQEIYLIVNNY